MLITQALALFREEHVVEVRHILLLQVRVRFHGMDLIGSLDIEPIRISRPEGRSHIRLLIALSSRCHDHRLLLRRKSGEPQEQVSSGYRGQSHTFSLCS